VKNRFETGILGFFRVQLKAWRAPPPPVKRLLSGRMPATIAGSVHFHPVHKLPSAFGPLRLMKLFQKIFSDPAWKAP
jgi:hypothetical protein